MQSHNREVQKEVQKLKDKGEIEDFILSTGSKHRIVEFQVKGVWYSTVYSSTPGTPYANNFVRQQIRRRIRTLQIT